ncbi:glycosyltransferase [Cryobacterium sp. M91]|uniref:glycosyltransferase n=1 Tax=Cryobacterium sp. M91 TaxID=2048294 RepID=UPI000CE3F847|nr:glycosyltransferase [Cryobacterium sp. M91]
MPAPQEQDTATSASTQAPAADKNLNRVTIVVPVYGDWASLRSCIAALIEHAPADSYDVLIVNDCGPDADVIEAGLLGMIFGLPNFRYERNPSNLGFVRTCNRAAFELDRTSNDLLLLNSDTRITPGSLDEMRRVLNLSERHAVVCPRSNDATIATLPFYQRDRFADRDEARTARVFDAISPSLPRYYITPVAIGFCFLIRRSLVANNGLFDEVFGMGYNEENDFCLRLNALGYSSLIANHALVYHVGSTSFGTEQRAMLEAENSKILHARYPFYPAAVSNFIKNEYSVLDRFADIIAHPDGPGKKVLIDLHHLSLAFDGSTKNALSFLQFVKENVDPGSIAVTVAAPQDVIDFFDLHSSDLRVIPYGDIDEVFDVGVAIAPVTSLGQITSLNRFCAKWVVSYLDVIALRSWGLRLMVPYKPEIVHAALAYADSVVAISEATLDDAMDFFPDLQTLRSRTAVLHQGSGLPADVTEVNHFSAAITPACAEVIARGNYVLVIGNAFPHKQVRSALEALRSSALPIVILGSPDIAREFPMMHALPGGTLTDAEVGTVYSRARVVVFPSAYEGFGLPVPEAAQLNKRIVVFDTAVAREVTTALALEENVSFFSLFSELTARVQTAYDAEPLVTSSAPALRTLADYNRDFWGQVLATLDAPIDQDRLRRRHSAVRTMTIVTDDLLQRTALYLHELTEIKNSQKYRLSLSVARVLGPLGRVVGRGRNPGAALQMRDIERT